MSIFLHALLSSIGQLPLFLVWIVGIIIAFNSWQKHPNVSLLTIIALIGFIILSVTHSFFVAWLPLNIATQKMSTQQVALFFSVMNVIYSILSAILWAILLVAIFGLRIKRTLK